MLVLVLGTLVLLFAAYELWGTGLITASHQQALRRQFHSEIEGRGPPLGAGGSRATAPTVRSTAPVTRSAAVPTVLAPPGNGEPIGVIDIPAVGVDFVVVQGTDEHDLELGPGHYVGTSMPGNPGNAAIAGHRTTYLHPFYSLGGVRRGDPIYVTTLQGRFRYDVTGTTVVAPTDVAVLDPTSVPTLTLTTCNPPYSAVTRLVVRAVLVSPSGSPTGSPTGSSPGAPSSAGPSPGAPSAGVAARARTLGTGTGTGGLGPALWWGLLALAAGVSTVLVWRRTGRWWVGAAGTIVLLGLLWVWFGALSQVLPSGY